MGKESVVKYLLASSAAFFSSIRVSVGTVTSNGSEAVLEAHRPMIKIAGG